MDAIGRMDRCFSNGMDGMDNHPTDYFKIVMGGQQTFFDTKETKGEINHYLMMKKQLAN